MAAGCGGGEPLTREQYVSELSAMCEDFAAREREIGEPQTLADLAERGPRILDAFEETILDGVRTLEAPNEIAAEASRLVELAGRQRDTIAGLIDAAKDGDAARARELDSTNQALNEEANAITRKLGAEGCAT